MRPCGRGCCGPYRHRSQGRGEEVWVQRLHIDSVAKDVVRQKQPDARVATARVNNEDQRGRV